MAFNWSPYYSSYPKEAKVDILKDIIKVEWPRRHDPEVRDLVRAFLKDVVIDLRDEMVLP